MKMHVARNGLVVVMLSLAVSACGAGESDSLDLKISGEATAADAGLPAYPGSKPYKDAEQSTSGANIGLSTPLFGIKVVGMNLEAADDPDRVAAFYRKALSKYGDVLDCSDAESNKNANESGDRLACDADDPGSHSVLYKVGTKDDHRIVAIKPHGSGTRFSLVHIDVRG